MSTTAGADSAQSAKAATPPSLRKRFFFTSLEWKQLRLASIFILPWLIGLVGFTLYPIIYTVYLSFTRYNGLKDPVWIGLANYQRLWDDNVYHKVFINTFYYVLMAVPIGVVVAMVLALCMNADLPEVPIYRTILYLPSVLPLVALSFIFMALLDPNKGIINQLLGNIGLGTPNWFGDPDWVKPAIVVMAQFTAGQIALVFLAGLKGIPQSLYEAAMLDGAGVWSRFRNVTLPLMTPVILYDLILGISGGLQVFTQSFIITQGGPAKASTFMANYIYDNAFRYSNMGYASAQGVVLFLITFIIAGVVFSTSNKWVNYDLN
ncbi:MAG: sugar ABC transporter permease [Thermomicrobiales bacterium]